MPLFNLLERNWPHYGYNMIYLLYLVIFLQFADAISTTIALKSPNIQEKNPILRKLFERFGILQTLVIIKSIFCIVLILYYTTIPLYILIGIIVVYLAVIVNNLIVYRKSRI